MFMGVVDSWLIYQNSSQFVAQANMNSCVKGLIEQLSLVLIQRWNNPTMHINNFVCLRPFNPFTCNPSNYINFLAIN